ncbi:sulfur oxidation c-type cytochrome SoxX [Pseudothioclava nitratireducens]|mgnify:CR=1 FL=1|jgi:sulfur-oxidizing protein SoxX|uniref:sulfur oxidation c-type cytochrome SoxX n=1 Tax=Pseudothioclava nitratireducens TaxID=1928646 RepID=UPI0023D97B4E|nr:sulfur oxidation c-type cytochrome SoxX [Defluviimonas nitratireducens]MDF1619402.1 sulfur oxidation c-type cytochrome SoxX [Defluviimonas nitratireducens]
MKRHVVLATAVIFAAGAAFAETAPTEVTFEEGAVAQSLTGVPGNPEEGAKVAATRPLGNCVACHEISALSADFQGNVGPSLNGAADRWEEAQLRGIVIDAKHTFEGTVMPGMYKTGPFIRPGDAYTGKAAPADLPPILTAQQVEDVVAFLMTLKE